MCSAGETAGYRWKSTDDGHINVRGVLKCDYSSDKSSLFIQPVYFLSSSSLQCNEDEDTRLFIQNVILIKPICRKGREELGRCASFNPVSKG